MSLDYLTIDSLNKCYDELNFYKKIRKIIEIYKI